MFVIALTWCLNPCLLVCLCLFSSGSQTSLLFAPGPALLWWERFRHWYICLYSMVVQKGSGWDYWFIACCGTCPRWDSCMSAEAVLRIVLQARQPCHLAKSPDKGKIRERWGFPCGIWIFNQCLSRVLLQTPNFLFPICHWWLELQFAPGNGAEHWSWSIG